MLPRVFTIALTALISLVWAGNVVVGFIDPERHDPTINAIFAVVVGAVYALGRKDSEAVRAVRRRLAKVISGDNEPEGPPREEEAES